jgi:hypothetical protein
VSIRSTSGAGSPFISLDIAGCSPPQAALGAGPAPCYSIRAVRKRGSRGAYACGKSASEQSWKIFSMLSKRRTR